MSLPPGTRLGVFTLLQEIGRGGMGEVYRARDTKLDRDVAIKVLPEAFAHDSERLARFLREAKTLASLNHPNIAAIYGLEESDGIKALVMELVEGDDLSQRIARGAIPIDEALPMAKQIADALEAAHEQHIIHRDLKTANIKVRADGTVKVLDFGLAKAMEPVGAMSVSVSQAPTITTPALMTGVGMILGTAAYMSPEQARGKPVDKRADIWAFGAVLFEMLTGTRAFEGEDVGQTLARVVEREPDFGALPPSVPARVSQVLRVCLRKDPKQRVGDIGAVRLALEGAFETAAPQATATAASASRQRRPLIAALVVAVLGLIALAVPAVRYLRQTPPPAPPETRLEIATPATSDVTSLALSPDGRQIVFVASEDGASRLWVRPLDTTAVQPLAGTDGASHPFWSPDSRSIGFFADGKPEAARSVGGRSADAGARSPGSRRDVECGRRHPLRTQLSWAPLSCASRGRRRRPRDDARRRSDRPPVSAVLAGRTAVPVLRHRVGGDRRHLSRRARRHRRHARDCRRHRRGVSANRAWVHRSVSRRWMAALWAPGDAGRPALRSRARRPERRSRDRGRRARHRRQLQRGGVFGLGDGPGDLPGRWSRSDAIDVVRSGGQGARDAGAPDARQGDLALSPDGRQVAVSRVAQGNTDIWLIDAARTTRFTFDPAIDRYPVWSPDGRRLVFSRSRAGIYDLYQKPANGAGAEALLLASPETKAASSWSPDGRSLLYTNLSPKTSYDLWVLPMAGDPKPLPFLESTFYEGNGAFSPDGHWVAYGSDESGRREIYVRPFPGPGGQWQVSTAGGKDPRWRPDGKALYYIAPDGRLMAAPIASSGTALQPGLPTALFQPRIALGGTPVIGYRQQYDVAPDGRFLINVSVEEGTAAPITVITNWNPEAKK